LRVCDAHEGDINDIVGGDAHSFYDLNAFPEGSEIVSEKRCITIIPKQRKVTLVRAFFKRVVAYPTTSFIKNSALSETSDDKT
jgi:hypothetical protein